MTRRFKFYLAGSLIILGLFWRWVGLGIETDDYIYFLKPWFDTLASHPGLSAFGEPFSNYAPLYLYLIKILTWLPFGSLASIKGLSIFFDLVLAVLAALIIGRIRPQAERADQWLVAAAVWLAPTVVLNSAWWSQSDALYASFVLLSFWIMIDPRRRRPGWAAAAFGVALSLKIQAVFFLPLFVGWLWSDRNLSGRLWWLGLLLAVYGLFVVPAWLGGGSLFALLTIYAHQASEYTALTLSAPTIFAFFAAEPLAEPVRQGIAWAGVGVAFLAALGLAYLAGRRWSASRLVLLALVGSLLLPFLLPRMHERYFYLADVFSIIFAGVSPRRWYVPVAVIGASLLSYAPYLSKTVPEFSFLIFDLRVAATLMLLVLGSLWPLVMHSVRSRTGVH